MGHENDRYLNIIHFSLYCYELTVMSVCHTRTSRRMHKRANYFYFFILSDSTHLLSIIIGFNSDRSDLKIREMFPLKRLLHTCIVVELGGYSAYK